MTLMQSMALGQTGTDIQELLDEVRDAVNQRGDFDDHEHQMEYVDSTIMMIQDKLTKLQEKC